MSRYLHYSRHAIFGSHVSAAGGLENAPANSRAVGGEVFQFFSRPPQGGKPKPVTDTDVKKFKQAMKDNAQKECYIHSPYFINLASKDNRIRYGSISVLKEELERGSLLGTKYLMFHPGSAKDVGAKKGIQMVVEGIAEILKGYKGSCELLVEISA
ncbi:MAG: TIM barrel protein, partial [bacterium]